MIRETLPTRRESDLATLDLNGRPFYEICISHYEDERQPKFL